MSWLETFFREQKASPCQKIGPAQIVSAKDRSFWLDGHILGNITWQRFIARLCAHGPVNPLVPGSILQILPGTYTVLGGVADNLEIVMC